MNYTINSGGTSITEGNPITILSGCGNGITIKEFDITDFLFNSDNDGIACYVNDKKIKWERISNTFIVLNKPFTIDLDFSISFFNMKQVSTYYLTMAFMTSSSSYIIVIRIPTCNNFEASKVVMKDINLDFFLFWGQ